LRTFTLATVLLLALYGCGETENEALTACRKSLKEHPDFPIGGRFDKPYMILPTKDGGFIIAQDVISSVPPYSTSCLFRNSQVEVAKIGPRSY
jgi:hypothetical protein